MENADARVLPPACLARRVLISLVVFLFFARGFSTSLLYSLLPKLKSLFSLTYSQAMLIQMFFFLGYLVFSIPAAWLAARLGYTRAILLGIAVMAGGCLTFCLAAAMKVYSGFLAALFVVATGIILLQVATNPFIATLGSAQGAYSRLTLAQAFNSLGTTIAPLVGAWLILGPTGLSPGYAAVAMRVTSTASLQLPFLAVAVALAITAGLLWTRPAGQVGCPQAQDLKSGFSLLKEKRFLFATLSIFVYVGAEVSVGSIIVSYLTLPSVLSVSAAGASELLSLYWGAAMLGRFLGSAALRVVPGHAAVAACAGAAMLAALISFGTTGAVAAVAVIAIGLFNSIIFPTLFGLGIAHLGGRTAEGSGILCMAISGGAVIPMLTGLVADRVDLGTALLVPASCYAWIVFYGAVIARPRAA